MLKISTRHARTHLGFVLGGPGSDLTSGQRGNESEKYAFCTFCKNTFFCPIFEGLTVRSDPLTGM